MNVTITRADEALRIAYWRSSMERGRRFMDRLLEYPVHDRIEPLASIENAARSAGVDMEFSTTPIVGDIPRIFELREGLIEPLMAAGREMNRGGWVLKIEDAFRSRDVQRTVAHQPSIFDVLLKRVSWEVGGREPEVELVLRRFSTLCANAPKVAGHMSGCAIDISVLDRDTRTEVDRGGRYLEISELMPMASPFAAPEALQHRALITMLMEKHGFIAYPYEFWHYSQGDVFAESLRCTGRPGRYAAVTRDARTGAIEPITDLMAPLNALEDIREEIVKARGRMHTR
jgi:D-alanyl-D-alanine dipeptidase